MEKFIADTLKELGVPAHIDGYEYLKTAIMQQLKTKTCVMEMYHKIAMIHATTTLRVERAIRYAVQMSADRGNNEMLYKLFRYSYSCVRGRPTNTEFIFTLTEYVRLNYKEVNV